MTNRIARRIALAAIIAAAIMIGVLALRIADSMIDFADRAIPSERITEDDPRWDCATMGNRTCGPN